MTLGTVASHGIPRHRWQGNWLLCLLPIGSQVPGPKVLALVPPQVKGWSTNCKESSINQHTKSRPASLQRLEIILHAPSFKFAADQAKKSDWGGGVAGLLLPGYRATGLPRCTCDRQMQKWDFMLKPGRFNHQWELFWNQGDLTIKHCDQFFQFF